MRKLKRSLSGSDKEISELKAKLKESEAARKRLAADYSNFEKRTHDAREALSQHVTTRLLERLFPIFDNFYRASTHVPDIALDGDLSRLSDDEFKKIRNYFIGLRLIEKQMEDVLIEVGLRRIPTRGNLFDPTLHEAISHEQNADVPADHIIDEIEAGWHIQSKVIKPAKVRVSKG